MIREVLYCVHESFTIPKITAIKPEGWKWEKGELDEKIFKIVKLDLTKEQIKNIADNNDYCINSKTNPTSIVETPTQFKYNKGLEEIN